MNDNYIIYPETLNYLHYSQNIIHPFLIEMEEFASINHMPIIHRESGFFLHWFLKTRNFDKILEIGTNIGYSTIWMSLANQKTEIITIDKDEKIQINAKENFAKTNCKNIKCITSEALPFLKQLTEKEMFDLVFIDANKQENIDYVESLFSHLNNKATIIVDNVLWKGRTTGKHEIEKNQRSSTKAILNFNKYMLNNNSFFTTILPIGDGLLCANRIN